MIHTKPQSSVVVFFLQIMQNVVVSLLENFFYLILWNEEKERDGRPRPDSQRCRPNVITRSAAVVSTRFLLCVRSCAFFLICSDIYAAYFSHRRKFSWTLMTGMVTAGMFNSLQLVLRWPHVVIKVVITTMRKHLTAQKEKYYSSRKFQYWSWIVLRTWKSQKLEKGKWKRLPM